MLTAFSDSNPSCYAWVSQKSEGPFYCKKCNIEVILKKGLIKQHHFAHKPPKQCMFGYGESDIHYKAQRTFGLDIIHYCYSHIGLTPL